MARILLLLPICMLLQDQHARLLEASRSLLAAAQPDQDDAASRILHKDPLVFLQMSLDRYGREVQSYSCLLCKRERIEGTLRAPEEVNVIFKEKPHSVWMSWKSGARLAKKVLFVKGENDDCLLAMPAGLFSIVGVQARKLDHPDSKRSGRYLVSEFGIKIGTERILRDMRRAQQSGTLKVRYEGIVAVPQLDNRRCHKLVRLIDPAEEDGVCEGIFFFDVENWLQTGSILYDADKNLIAEYFFRELQLNPAIPPKQFAREAL